MEDFEHLKFTILILGVIIFITPIFVLGYHDKTTHPALTGEIIDLFDHLIKAAI